MLYKKLPESKQKLVLSPRKKQNIIITVIKTIQNRNCGINHHHRTRDYTCCILTLVCSYLHTIETIMVIVPQNTKTGVLFYI